MYFIVGGWGEKKKHIKKLITKKKLKKLKHMQHKHMHHTHTHHHIIHIHHIHNHNHSSHLLQGVSSGAVTTMHHFHLSLLLLLFYHYCCFWVVVYFNLNSCFPLIWVCWFQLWHPFRLVKCISEDTVYFTVFQSQLHHCMLWSIEYADHHQIVQMNILYQYEVIRNVSMQQSVIWCICKDNEHF